MKTTLSNLASNGFKNGKLHITPTGLQGGSGRVRGRGGSGGFNTYLGCKRLERLGPSRTPRNSAGACMKAGVVRSKMKLRTRTEQCLELESMGARTRESIGVSGRPRVFSKLVL